MKKIIVLGLVLAMALSLSVAANAAFVKDTDWAVYMQAGNNTWNTTQNNWGVAGADIKMGNAAAPSVTVGTAMSSTTTAYIRNMDPAAGSNGYTVQTIAAADQGTDAVVQTWDNIKLFVGSAYSSTALSLRIWTIGISADGPQIVLKVKSADAGTGFTADQVLFDSATAVPDETVDTSKHYPWTTINLLPFKTALQAANIDGAHVVFSLTATTPASGPVVITPEPGSMIALFSGLVGLVGFGIRRRK